MCDIYEFRAYTCAYLYFLILAYINISIIRYELFQNNNYTVYNLSVILTSILHIIF